MEHPLILEIPKNNQSLNDFFVGKFVQIYIQDCPYIRISERLTHSSILEQTLKEFHISQRAYVRIGNRILLSPKENDYNAIGMGFYEANEGNITLKGKSECYQIGPNQDHLSKLLSLYNPSLKKFNIQIVK